MSKKAIQHGRPVHIPDDYSSVAEMLVHISKTYPHKGLTYIDGSGREEFESYMELKEQAEKKLTALYKNGLKSGDILILVIENSKEFYHAYWGCIFGGIIPAPVSHPSSWEVGADGIKKLTRIWEVLNKPKMLIEEKNKLDCLKLKDTEQFGDLEFLVTQEVTSDEKSSLLKTGLDDLIFLQFSSGSTGLPKGVKLTNRNILTNLIALKYCLEIKETDNSFTWVPHTHDMGLFVQHLAPMLNGSSIMIFSSYTFVRSPYLFLKKMTEYKASWFCSTNFGFDWMTRNVSDEKLDTLDLSSIRFALNGAEPISVEVTNRFIEKFSKCGFKETMMLPSYGMAEATVGITSPVIGSRPKIALVSRKKMICDNLICQPEDNEDIVEFYHEGYPLNGVSIRITDEEGYVLKEREIGEIQVKGNSVTSGYYNNEEVTRQIINGGWLKTGDLGFIKEDSLVITGRKKDIIFVRGQNYYAHDLEEVIFKYKIVARDNLVFAGCFNSRLQKEEILVFVKDRFTTEKFLPLKEQIKSQMHESLGVDITHVIPVRTIPKTTSGKVQRYILRNNYENGVYDNIIKEIDSHDKREMENQTVSSFESGELQEYLHQCWAEILNIPKNSFTPEDSFRALGGNSISMYQLLSRLEDYLGREIGAEVFIRCRTIQQMAEYVEKLPAIKTAIDSLEEKQKEKKGKKAVAITGIAFRLPDAVTQKEFWANLSSKKDSISRVSRRRKELSKEWEWDNWLGELDNIECFDNEFFEISEEEAKFMDPQHRLILETAHEALDDAGVITNTEEEKNIGVYVGVNGNTYNQFLIDYIRQNGMEKVHPNAMVRNLLNIAAATVSHQYNFTGPAMAIDTACSSFLVSLHNAVRELRENNITGAVVATSNIMENKTVHLLAEKAGILTDSNKSKVFDKAADGSVLGEGIVVVYLESLEDAIKGNKNIYGIIRGSAVNNDGYSLGIMAPNPGGQYEALKAAYRDAELSPLDITYMEAHGTGTTIGDPIEMNALSKLFREAGYTEGDKCIGIGSVKTNIGHLLPAAGGASLVKVLLSMKHKKLVPSLHMEEINPALQIEKTPFYIVTDTKNWIPPTGGARIAGITSLGLGGTNANVIVEEYNADLVNTVYSDCHMLTVSAKTKKALERAICDMEQLVNEVQTDRINNICFTRNRYREHYEYRAACILSVKKSKEKAEFIRGTQKKAKIKVGVCIGDFINCKENLIHIKEDEQAFFYKIYAEVMNYVDGKIEIDSERKRLDHFVYCCTILFDLQKKGIEISCMTGTGSGRILADMYNNKINMGQAVKAFLEYNNSEIKDEQVSQKVDITIHMFQKENEAVELILDNGEIFFQKNTVSESYEFLLNSIIAQLYIRGVKIDWAKFHPDGTGRITNLPAYPFESKVIWLDM